MSEFSVHNETDEVYQDNIAVVVLLLLLFLLLWYNKNDSESLTLPFRFIPKDKKSQAKSEIINDKCCKPNCSWFAVLLSKYLICGESSVHKANWRILLQ